jgi:hypothetical protein
VATPDYTGDPRSHGLVGTHIALIWTLSVLIGVALVSTQIGGYRVTAAARDRHAARLLF